MGFTSQKLLNGKFFSVYAAADSFHTQLFCHIDILYGDARVALKAGDDIMLTKILKF